jgi:prephenate dehydrogenase
MKMVKRIAIIGMGKLGVSFGMALAGKKDQFTTAGLDRSGDITREVGKLKIFDTLTNRLPELLQGADVVILAVPFDEVKITLESIAPLISKNTLILETSPVKKATYDWAENTLPAGTQFLSFTPILNPRHLMETETGMIAASADLFTDGLFLTFGTEFTSAESTHFATGLAETLGGELYFGEAAEFDGLLAAYEILPGLVAAAFFNSVTSQGGWHYGCKLTNEKFANLTHPLTELPEREKFGSAAIANRENILRVMDNILRELQIIRDDLENKRGAELQERIGQAHSGHSSWWKSRQSGNWEQSGKDNTRGDDGFFTAALGIPPIKKKK